VFAGVDGEVDVVEDVAVAEGDVDVAHSQERLGGGSFGAGGHLV